MKLITIFDEKTTDVITQLAEDDLGNVTGMCAEGVSVIVDGELLSHDLEPLEGSTALKCTCGATAKDLDIVKTLTSYVHKGNLDDIEIEYKVVCSKCGREGDLAANKEGAILSWNENILKGRLQ